MYKGKNMVCTGDSTTWTVGLRVYPDLIAQLIAQNKRPISVTNKGHGGAMSTGLSNIFKQYIIPNEFSLITICLGMNDSKNLTIPVATFETNVSNIVNMIKTYRPGTEIILCAPSQTSEPGRAPNIQLYRDKMRAIATAQSTFFADFSQAFTSAQIGTYTTDGIHPNLAGHTLIANNILFPVIQNTNFYKGL